VSLRPSAVLVIAALLGASLAGCSAAAGGENGEIEQSPLEKIFSEVYGMGGSEEEQQAAFEEQQTKSEELVAECMAEEGFEYTPAGGSISFGSDEEWNPDDREWVSQYGYGMINSPGADTPPEPEIADPNADYVSSLSESEMTAYQEALYGVMDEEATEYRWEDSGCYGWANHEIEGDDPSQSDEHKPLFAALEEFWTDSQNDPRYDELNNAWSSCMSDAGFDYSKQPDAQNDFNEQLNAYYESQTEWIEDDPKLAELGDEEIEVALADLECREKSDYRSKSRTVQFELEKTFITEHQAEIDALLADVEAKKD